MKKKGLLLVVALLALSGLMAAMAYSQATITNAASLTVANTNEALLALKPLGGVGNLDETARLVDGDLVFSFGRGMGPFARAGKEYGLQRDSVYQWGGNANTGMFEIWNNSRDHIHVSMGTVNVPAGVRIFVKSTSGNDLTAGERPWIEITNKNSVKVEHCSINEGTQHYIAVRIEVSKTAPNVTSSDMKIIVGAEAVVRPY